MKKKWVAQQYTGTGKVSMVHLTPSAPAPLSQSFGIVKQAVFTILEGTTHKIAEAAKI